MSDVLEGHEQQAPDAGRDDFVQHILGAHLIDGELPDDDNNPLDLLEEEDEDDLDEPADEDEVLGVLEDFFGEDDEAEEDDLGAEMAAAFLRNAGDVPDADAAEIDRLVAAHKAIVPNEVAVFEGIRSLEDAGRIVNRDERAAKLQDISDVMDAVAVRRRALLAELRPYPLAQEVARNESVANGWACLTTIADHLPGDFATMDPAKMQLRLGTLMATREEKAGILERAKAGFTLNGIDVSQALGDRMKAIIEPVSAKAFERQSFYFDQFVAAPPPEMLQELGRITDRIVDQAQQILDAGGRLKDVEQLMAQTGIPKEWWPPQFIDTLQAWRKTERAMMEERVAEAFKTSPDLKSIAGMAEFFGRTLPEGAEGVGAAVGLIMGQPAVGEAVNSMLASISAGYDLGAPAIEALTSGDFSSLPEKTKEALQKSLQSSMELVGAAVNVAAGALTTAGKIADAVGATAAADALSQVIPGLSIAACGVNLALALKNLAKHGIKRGQTELMKGDALRALGDASMEDGGAFLKTLDNECTQRDKKMIEAGIDVGVAGLNLGGAIAGTAGGHYGLAVNAGIKVLTTGISFGSKMVFTGIDWGEARRAKKLLKEAQAGNPVARMEIFKDSALYAKMYICVLCQEGDPLAIKFVAQRGIEEPDLTDAMSLKILREAMLDSAGQKDERDVEDNLLLEYTPDIVKAAGEGAAAIGRKVGKAATYVADKAKGNDRPYNAGWSHQGAIELTQAHWDDVKSQAKEAGLHTQGTGIGAALAKAADKVAQARAAVAAQGDAMTDAAQSEALQKALLAAIAALDAAYAKAYKYTPLTTPTGDPAKPELHRGMSVYLGLLCTRIGEERADLETYMRATGLKNVDWQPGTPSDPMDLAAWEINWAAGVKAACLPKSDAGLLKAMKAASEAKAKQEANETSRDLAFEYSGALNDLIAASNACLKLTEAVPGMARYVVDIRTQAAADRRALDSVIAAVNWAPPIPEGNEITADRWNALFATAVERGFVRKSGGDGGVGAALAKVRELQQAEAAAAAGKDKLKARRNFAKAAGKMLIAQRKFLKAQPDVSESLKKFVANAYALANQIQDDFSAQRAQVTFQTTCGLNKASWQATYAAAIAAGAVAACKDGRKALSKVLDDLTSNFGKLRKALAQDKFDDALKLGPEVVRCIDGVIDAIDGIDVKLGRTDKYAENTTMRTYLEGLRALAAERANHPLVQLAVRGQISNMGGVPFAPAAFRIATQNFSDVKDDAVEAGVIPKKDTGMRKALGKYNKAMQKLYRARPGNDAARLDAAEAEFRIACGGVRQTAEGLRDWSQNPAWQVYIDGIVAEMTHVEGIELGA